jgi:glycogen debranching enzyme
VPSFDLTDPRHDPQRYWRGPSWLNTTWLVAQGLRQHGSRRSGLRTGEDIVALAAQSGLWEYFHPLTGTGHGTDRFSWSAALLIEVLLSRR